MAFDIYIYVNMGVTRSVRTSGMHPTIINNFHNSFNIFDRIKLIIYLFLPHIKRGLIKMKIIGSNIRIESNKYSLIYEHFHNCFNIFDRIKLIIYLFLPHIERGLIKMQIIGSIKPVI